jgi:DNA-binding CsgD family transcriptional regulator
VDRPADGDLVPKQVLDLLPERIALLDGDGMVRWANASWQEDQRDRIDGIVERARVGESLLRDGDGAVARSPVAGGIRAVIDGTASHFEVELDASGSAGTWIVSATRLGLGSIAVVVKQGRPIRRPTSVLRARSDRDVDLIAVAPRGRLSAKADEHVFDEEPTPREREVLDGMMRGLDNHAIAQELGIGYTSVRAHVRSLIAKAGARSRLEVVARAYRGGLAKLDAHGDAAAASSETA